MATKENGKVRTQGTKHAQPKLVKSQNHQKNLKRRPYNMASSFYNGTNRSITSTFNLVPTMVSTTWVATHKQRSMIECPKKTSATISSSLKPK